MPPNFFGCIVFPEKHNRDSLTRFYGTKRMNNFELTNQIQYYLPKSLSQQLRKTLLGTSVIKTAQCTLPPFTPIASSF